MPGKIILHVMVVGFHHKKGCQLEYCYPPLADGQSSDSPELADEWKNLPNLALPDGAHNYDADYVYFILPALGEGKESVYGISCYRQIDALELENRTPDITRGSVQKSVVVLSTLPLFGALRTRLELITHAYFDGKDFSKVSLLTDTYTSLTNCMTPNALDSQLNCDLSVRDLLLTYKHDLLVLFKLLLLERRVVMYHCPPSELTSRLLALVSLLPGFLKGGGLRYSSFVGPLRTASIESFVDIRTSAPSPPPPADSDSELGLNLDSARLEIHSSAVASGENSPSQRSASPSEQEDSGSGKRLRAFRSLTTNMSAAGSFLKVKLASAASSASSAVSSVASRSRPENDVGVEEDSSVADKFDDPRTAVDEFGMPLPVFAESNLFLPFVSLHNIDLMENPAIRAFVLGANNFLYVQKKQLADVFVGSVSVEWISDPELRRALQLTSADLRFIDCLLNCVVASTAQSSTASLEDQQQEDVFEGSDSRHHSRRSKKKKKKTSRRVPSDWDGSDEWLRLQFRDYLLSMLKASSIGSAAPSPSMTSLNTTSEPAETAPENGVAVEAGDTVEKKEDEEEAAEKKTEGEEKKEELAGSHPGDFNANFLRMLKTTRHYRMWRTGLADYPGMVELSPNHPAHGQWKLDDLQLRINHLLTHTEQGRRINSAVQTTGKMVQETGKVVGTAITSARSAVSSLWSGFSKTAANRFGRQPAADAGDGTNDGQQQPAEDNPADVVS